MILRGFIIVLFIIPSMLFAQNSIRFATYNVGLGRDGPGILLKDIQSRDDDILALVTIIAQSAPDVLLLTNFDGDYRNLAAQEFIALIERETGAKYPYFFATEGNSGVPSGFDLNGNGWLHDWADNWGFGLFPGHENMLLLSKHPINSSGIITYPDFLWRDLANATPPRNTDGSPFLSADAWQVFRLASKDYWHLGIDLPGGQQIDILASHATPPVFDGEENLNGLRNDAEIRFWVGYVAELDDPFVILADFNADPADGAGVGLSINQLLTHPKITDPRPQSLAAAQASQDQQGVNATQVGDPATDTADWSDDEIGNLRVDYVLPSSDLTVTESGVFWPTVESPLLKTAGTAHRLVWVDIRFP